MYVTNMFLSLVLGLILNFLNLLVSNLRLGTHLRRNILMKKFYMFGLALLLSMLVGFTNIAFAQENVKSLRGVNAIDAASQAPSMHRQLPDSDPIERDYVQQPPLIPHKIDGYKVNFKFNKCLTCHSWANYREADATKISQTHFENSQGEMLANVSSRRYFCLQCHVSQTDVDVLIKNTFKAVPLLQK